MWSRLALSSLLVVAVAPRAVGAARTDRLAGGRIEAVVAVAGGVVALRDGAAVFLDPDGHVRGRCAETPQAPPREHPRPRRDPTDAEDALRLAGLPDDDDDSPEAEDALEDEGLGARSRARPTPPAEETIARALAATPGGQVVWLATSTGLVRARADGSACARVAALAGRDVALVAAGGPRVVAVAGDTVWRSLDDGASFEVAAVLPSRPRAVAVTGDGAHALVATDDGVFDPIGPRAVERVLDRSAGALAACGQTILMLAADGSYAWTPGGEVARAGPRPPARSLACAEWAGRGARAAARFVAAGVGLWTSADGRSWVEESAGLGLSLAGAASARHDGEGRDGWWLAADDGLWRADVAPESALDVVARAPALGARAAPQARRAPEIWAAMLPRVGVALGGHSQADARSEWHVWLLVTLPLGRSPRRVADLAELRARQARQRAALEAEALWLRVAGPRDGETAARIRAIADEREALR